MMRRTCALALVGVAAAEHLKLQNTKAERALEAFKKVNRYMGSTWEGMYTGLYGPTSTIDKIDEDCFGEWIADDIEFIHNYF